jgi:hypothetical protein
MPSYQRVARCSLGAVGRFGLVTALGLACSTRVPFKAERTSDGDERPAAGRDAFTPQPDAATETSAAAIETNGPVTGETDAGAAQTSASQNPSGTTTSFATTSDTASTTTNISTSSDVTTSTVPAVPTRQLSIPLPDAAAKFAILVSVDGLAARYLDQLIVEGRAPTFLALQSLAAWTHNARTDKTHTYTLPNHTCMLTGLPVSPVPGLESYRAHFYTANSDPGSDATLHQLRFPDHTYTPSMFDVAHDNGLMTAMFASKTKFSLFSQTYNDAGRPDTIGINDGTHKIDKVVINSDPTAMIAAFITQLETLPPHLTFVHLNQPDGAGHSLGWGSPEYMNAVVAMDALLGQLLNAIQQGQLRNRTALIVTTDHGGVDFSHLGQDDANNYRIPFYVLAPGVAPGDIYSSLEHRVAPGADNPGYDELGQPLRNGDSGNLALDLLGLDPIPDSVMHSAGLLTSL